MKNKVLIIIPALIVQVAFVLAWHFLSTSGLVPSTVLVPPLTVLETLWYMAQSGELWDHLSWSLRRVAEGFAIGGGIGFILGLLIGKSKEFEKWVGPTINLIQLVPIFAWGPLLLVVLGIAEESKIAFIALACFFPILLATRQGVRSTQGKFMEVAQVYELSPINTILKVSIPAAIPYVMIGVRQSLALAWMAVVGAELMGAESGIGYLMVLSRQLFQLDGVLAGILLIGAIGIAINALIEAIEEKFIPWRTEV